jgi:hypothetical protein
MEWHVLDDPPVLDQLESWARTRNKGRARFLLIGIVMGMLYGGLIWIGVHFLLYFFQRGAFFSGITIDNVGFLLLGPVVGGINYYQRWSKNEIIYQTSISASKNEPS